MTCNCLTMCRIPDVETLGGRYPMPKHAPNCNAFKQCEFYILGLDGANCVMTEADFKRAISELDNSSEYSFSTVMLTQDQFDNMKEFTGF